MATTRRTPALTAECRRLFAEELTLKGGWQPGGTVPRIAAATSLTEQQVRDAIFSDGAAKWRKELADALRGR